MENVQAIQELDVQAIGMDIQTLFAETPLTKIGDVQVLFYSIQDYIRDKSILLQPRNHWCFKSQNSIHLSVSGQLPIQSCLPCSAIST